MEEKFRQGLSNQLRDEHANILNLREEFINFGADEGHINNLELIAEKLLSMYLDLSRPEKV